jgi:hypothetical protein
VRIDSCINYSLTAFPRTCISSRLHRTISLHIRAMFNGGFQLHHGLNRLDFDRVENRPFFLALHRQVAYVLSLFFLSCSYAGSAIFNAEDVFGRRSSLAGFCMVLTLGMIPMVPFFTSSIWLVRQICISGCWTCTTLSWIGFPRPATQSLG